MKENTINMVAEKRECVTYRCRNNTVYAGEIEGYDYVKCPVDGCGKIYRTSKSFSDHLLTEHHMTTKEVKEKYGINVVPKREIEKKNKHNKNKRIKIKIINNSIKEKEEIEHFTDIHGEIEGYDYNICPVDGCDTHIKCDIRKHMEKIHNMDNNSIDEKIRNSHNIIHVNPNYLKSSITIEEYIERLKNIGKMIVNGRIKDIKNKGIEKYHNDISTPTITKQKEIENKKEDTDRIENLIDKNIENINLINKSELKKLIINIIKDIFIGLSSSFEK